MGIGTLVWRGVRAAGAGIAGADEADPQALRRRMRVARDWQRSVDGRAPRLRPDQTIEVTRHGRFADVDPLVTEQGWRDPWKAAVVTGWLLACGAAAAAGYWAGRGPLAALRRTEDPDAPTIVHDGRV